MAMFGYLYLKNGLLDGEEIVPEDWVRKSTAVHVKRCENPRIRKLGGYGYLWWRHLDETVERHLETNDLLTARGVKGQRIHIIPHLNMVVAVTADILSEWQYDFDFSWKILHDYILPAVREK